MYTAPEEIVLKPEEKIAYKWYISGNSFPKLVGQYELVSVSRSETTAVYKHRKNGSEIRCDLNSIKRSLNLEKWFNRNGESFLRFGFAVDKAFVSAPVVYDENDKYLAHENTSGWND